MISPASWQWQYAQPGPYQTQLSPADEMAFRRWVAINNIPFNPNDPASDYDMRGFWKAGAQGAEINPIDKRLHYPDTYKTPYHQSFSALSKYATADAPTWQNNDTQLVDKNGNVLFDEQQAEDARQAQLQALKS